MTTMTTLTAVPSPLDPYLNRISLKVNEIVEPTSINVANKCRNFSESTMAVVQSYLNLKNAQQEEDEKFKNVLYEEYSQAQNETRRWSHEHRRALLRRDCTNEDLTKCLKSIELRVNTRLDNINKFDQVAFQVLGCLQKADALCAKKIDSYKLFNQISRIWLSDEKVYEEASNAMICLETQMYKCYVAQTQLENLKNPLWQSTAEKNTIHQLIQKQMDIIKEHEQAGALAYKTLAYYNAFVHKNRTINYEVWQKLSLLIAHIKRQYSNSEQMLSQIFEKKESHPVEMQKLSSETTLAAEDQQSTFEQSLDTQPRQLESLEFKMEKLSFKG